MAESLVTCNKLSNDQRSILSGTDLGQTGFRVAVGPGIYSNVIMQPGHETDLLTFIKCWDKDIHRILPPPFTILRVFMALLLNKGSALFCQNNALFNALTAMSQRLFWDVAPCSLIDIDRCF
jgi:hypothetical protein